MNQFYGSDCRRPLQAKCRTLSAPWFHGTESRKLLGTVPATGVPQAGPHTGDGVAHDSDILIILTLCTVICVLGLGSVVRCALRCRERVGLESAEHVTVRLAKMGMKKEAIDALPATVYASGSHLPETATDCPICLAEFAEGETVRMLPICNHSFHVQCIDTWLRSHSSCPSCRHSLRDVEEKSAKATLSCTTFQSSETRDTRTGQQTSVGESIRGIPNHATVQIGSAPPASSVGSGDGAEDAESGINITTSN